MHAIPLGADDGSIFHPLRQSVSFIRWIGGRPREMGTDARRHFFRCWLRHIHRWHIGDSEGRWPTDHGFDEWYGIPRSYDECLWAEDPWYDPKRDPVTRVLESRKGQAVNELEQLGDKGT
jgi:hypothetical protein